MFTPCDSASPITYRRRTVGSIVAVLVVPVDVELLAGVAPGVVGCRDLSRSGCRSSRRSRQTAQLYSEAVVTQIPATG